MYIFYYVVSAQTFSNVTTSQGISFSNSSFDGQGSGLSFYDFNQDGWDDISFAKENGMQGIFLNKQGSFQALTIRLSNLGETKHFCCRTQQK